MEQTLPMMTTPKIKYPKKYPVLGLMFDFRRSQRNNGTRVSRWLWLYLEFIANALNYSLFSLSLRQLKHQIPVSKLLTGI